MDLPNGETYRYIFSVLIIGEPIIHTCEQYVTYVIKAIITNRFFFLTRGAVHERIQKMANKKCELLGEKKSSLLDFVTIRYIQTQTLQRPFG